MRQLYVIAYRGDRQRDNCSIQLGKQVTIWHIVSALLQRVHVHVHVHAHVQVQVQVQVHVHVHVHVHVQVRAPAWL